MYRLVMFSGSSLGAGKTTFSRLLYRQLTEHGIKAIWLEEENLEALLAQFVPSWHINTVQPETFLEACRALLDHYSTIDAVLITDSGLPGYIHFFGRFPMATLEAFNTALYQILQPRDPLLIYLASDVSTAFARATAQRGEQWAENIRKFLNSWQLPFYTPKTKPFAAISDLITYFAALDESTSNLIAKWPGPKRFFPTTTTSPADLLALMLAEFGLATLPIAEFHGSTSLAAYAGTYERMTEGSAPQYLAIYVNNNQLQVNTYWPAGSVLVAIEEDVFQLESTDRWLRFTRDGAGRISGASYQLLGQQLEYRKIMANTVMETISTH